MSGLNPNSTFVYMYFVFLKPESEDDNHILKSKLQSGTFTTFPLKHDNFTFAVSSCTRLMSESKAYDVMERMKPDFFVNLGDFHYAGTNKSTYEDLLYAYHEQFKMKEQRQFYERVPLVYTFDDHDVGSNNADGLSPSTLQAVKAYKVRILVND